MILMIVILLSLSSIYFTRLLSKHNKKAAALSVAVLYFYLVAWIYSIFILDIANLGFNDFETYFSLLHGSSVYHSFVSLTKTMSVIPLELLFSIVAVATLVFVAGFAVAFHGFFEITRDFIRSSKEKEVNDSWTGRDNFFVPAVFSKSFDIIRFHCRMNC